MLQLADFYKNADPASAFKQLDAAGYVTTSPILGMRFTLERIARDAWRLTGCGPDDANDATQVPGGDAPDWRAVDAAMARLARSKPTTMADATQAAGNACLGEPQPDGSTAYRIALCDFVLEIAEHPEWTRLSFTDKEATREFNPRNERLADLGTRLRIAAGRTFSPHPGTRTTPVACVISHASDISVLLLGCFVTKDEQSIFIPIDPE